MLKDKESQLKIVPIATALNETQHDRNVAFTNNKLIEMILEICPSTKTFHFWSDGCSGQFRAKYVFQSFCCYPPSIKLTWNYEEVHYFNGIFIFL